MCALITVAAGLSGCIYVNHTESGNHNWWGDWQQDQRDVSGELRRIDFDARGTLYVVQGDQQRLRIEGDSDALEKVSVYERGDVLVITQSGRPSPWWEFDDARVSDNVYYLEVANIDEIRHTGHGEMKVGPITLERLIVTTSEHGDSKFSSINVRRFTLTVTDHGNVNIETLDTDQAMLTATSHGDVYAHDVSALDLSMRIEDHGEIWLAGAADTATVEMRDHGDLDSSRLKCEIVQIQTRNHANASVWVESTLRLQQSDHANVEWIGSPDVRENIALGSN